MALASLPALDLAQTPFRSSFMATVTQRVSDLTGKPIDTDGVIYHLVVEHPSGAMTMHNADIATLSEMRRYCLEVSQETREVTVNDNFSRTFQAGLDLEAGKFDRNK